MPKEIEEINKKVTIAAIDKELTTLEIVLSAKVARTAITLDEYIQMRIAQGAAKEVIKADLLKDLEEGGRIFGEFKNSLQPTFAGSTSRFRDIGTMAETGISATFRWVAILKNTCPDCIDNHNEDPKTWAEWEEFGLPRSGVTVCGQDCKCILVSAEAIALKQPVYRG